MEECLAVNEWEKEIASCWNNIISPARLDVGKDERVYDQILSFYYAYNGVPAMFQIVSDIYNWNYDSAVKALSIEADHNPEMKCLKDLKEKDTRKFLDTIEGTAAELVDNIDVQDLYDEVMKILSKNKLAVQVFDCEDPVNPIFDFEGNEEIFANDAQSRLFAFPKCDFEDIAYDMGMRNLRICSNASAPCYLKLEGIR